MEAPHRKRPFREREPERENFQNSERERERTLSVPWMDRERAVNELWLISMLKITVHSRYVHAHVHF